MTGLGTNPAMVIREVSTREQERRESASRARAEREAFLASLPTMSDQALADLVSANKRAYWEAEERGDVTRPGGRESVAAQSEYERRARIRTMPPIQEPTDIPSYIARTQSREMTETLDDIFGHGFLPFGPLKSYAGNAVQAVTGVESNYSRGPRMKAVAITAVPVVAGYIAYKKTDGSIPWTAGAAIGSIPVMTGIAFLAIAAAFSGGGY